MDNLTLAAIVVLAALIVVAAASAAPARRERFAPAQLAYGRRVGEATRELFREGRVTYREFKRRVGPGADAALYADSLRLHRAGEHAPEAYASVAW